MFFFLFFFNLHPVLPLCMFLVLCTEIFFFFFLTPRCFLHSLLLKIPLPLPLCFTHTLRRGRQMLVCYPLLHRPQPHKKENPSLLLLILLLNLLCIHHAHSDIWLQILSIRLLFPVALSQTVAAPDRPPSTCKTPSTDLTATPLHHFSILFPFFPPDSLFCFLWSF